MLLAASVWHSWIDPLQGNPYLFWSGIAGATAVFSGSIGGAILWWHHVNCHVDGCKRLGKPVHGTSFWACRIHHPHRHEPMTAEKIAHAAVHGHGSEPSYRPKGAAHE